MSTANWLRWNVSVGFSPDAAAFAAAEVLTVPECAARVAASWRAGLHVALSGEAEVLLRGDGAAADAFDAAALAHSGSPPGVVISWMDAEDVAHVAWRGYLDSWERRPGALVLRARVGLPVSQGAMVCRDLSMLDGYGSRERAFLPVVFGTIPAVEFVPLFAPESTRLHDAVALDAETVDLAAPVSWPATGRVQIEDEIIEYGTLESDPPRLGSLERETPREHPKSARVFLLPTGDCRWVAADHNATVSSVRAGERDGETVSPTVETEALDGRETTQAVLAALPLRLRHGAWPVVRETARRAASWSIEGATNAVFASLAFEGETPPVGAHFSASANLLVAHWLDDLGARSMRFDALRGLAILFDTTTGAPWPGATTLRVTVSKGDHSHTEDVTYGDAIAGAVEINASVDVSRETLLGSEPEVPPHHMRIDFDGVVDAGEAWGAPAAAIDGNMQAAATLDLGEAEEDGQLSFILRRDALPNGRPLVRVGIFCRARVSAVGALSVSLAAGEIEVATANAESGDWETFGAWEDAGGAMPDDLLSPGAEYTATLSAGASVEIAEVWLEVEQAPAVSLSSLFDGDATIEIVKPALASLPWSRVAIDLAPLLDSAGWELFEPGDEPLRVRFELRDAPSSFSLEVRGASWRIESLPALSAEPTTRLFGTVAGLLAEESDGLASPAACIQLLLTGAAFGGVPTEVVDSDEIAVSGALLAGEGVRFAALFADETPLVEALAAALGESACALVPGATWTIRPLDLADGGAAVTEDELLAPLAPVRWRLAELRERRIRVERLDGRFGPVLFIREVGGGARTWRTRWLAAGAAALMERVDRLCGSTLFALDSGVRPQLPPPDIGELRVLSVPSLPARPVRLAGWSLRPEGLRAELEG